MAHPVFNRLAARADRLASRASFLAAAALTARKHGVPIEDVLRPPSPQEQAQAALAARGLAKPDASRAAAARHEAIYLAVTVCGRPHKSMARAVGVAPKAIRKAVAQIEDRRDDPQYDRRLDEATLELMGEAA